jgi:predicted acyl esterase
LPVASLLNIQYLAASVLRVIRTVALAGIAALALTAPAHGAANSVLGSEAPCSAATLAGGGDARVCSGIAHTFDGTDIDVNVILPPAPATGSDGPYPTIGVYHGWGGSKVGITAQTSGFVRRGYAVFSMSDRGWGSSCGATDPKRVSDQAGCAKGYNHLLDTRYEVRDAQFLLGRLADEGIVDPQRIGATGPSYGGGMSMALGVLKDRYMDPDGSLHPWKSPNGTPMKIAAAAPEIPWTDLANSLQPNGATLDYVADAPYRGPKGDRRIGILKQSFVAGLYGLGTAGSNYAPPGTDPDADLTKWYALVNAGEPYDESPLAADIVDELTSHHSSYYIDHSEAPAPLLISNGWTDDLFPPDEAIRFYNRTRTQYPGNPVSLWFMDYGHQRGQKKAADTAKLAAAQDAWFDYYVKGAGSQPFRGVTTLTKTCPASAPSGSPQQAANWAKAAPGEVRLAGAAQQTILPAAGDPRVGQAFDPITGPGACATAAGDDQQGTATYRMAAAPAAGYTLLGSPTVVADFANPGRTSQVAARLLDVAPDGTETLVARGLWRPDVSTAPQRQVFQLHPIGWKFEAGHVAKLELLPSDQPYGRNSNGQLPVLVSNLELRLPVSEAPGANGGLVKSPAAKVLPPGYVLARDFKTNHGQGH